MKENIIEINILRLLFKLFIDDKKIKKEWKNIKFINLKSMYIQK